MIGRFPIIDISPVTYFGGEFVPAKAIPNETIPISATIIREGHETFKAFAIFVLRSSDTAAHAVLDRKSVV